MPIKVISLTIITVFSLSYLLVICMDIDALASSEYNLLYSADPIDEAIGKSAPESSNNYARVHPLFQVLGLQPHQAPSNEQSWNKLRWNGSITSSLSSISSENDTLLVFGRGSDTGLWYLEGDGSNWKDWQTLGGSMLSSSPSAVALNNGNIMVFVRGPEYSKALWFANWNGTGWNGPQQIGGELTSGPSALTLNNGTMMVFGRGSDLGLWYSTGNGSEWKPWNRLSNTPITSSPSAVATSNGSILIFVRGEDHHLKYSILDKEGLRWNDLGGRLTSAPSAVVANNGTVIVFARGADNSLWHISKNINSDEYGAWQRDGGRLSSAPTSVALNNGVIMVYSRGLDYGFWVTTFK